MQRAARPEKTKEQIEYEEATKNLKVLTTRLRLSQQGIDTSLISRQELDRVMAIYDRMDAIAADVRNRTAEIQKESNIEIQRINQKANEKYSQISKDLQAIIDQMKRVDKTPAIQQEVVQQEKEEVRQQISPEKVKEDVINAFADRIIQKVRKDVVDALEDYSNMFKMTAAVPTVGDKDKNAK